MCVCVPNASGHTLPNFGLATVHPAKSVAPPKVTNHNGNFIRELLRPDLRFSAKMPLALGKSKNLIMQRFHCFRQHARHWSRYITLTHQQILYRRWINNNCGFKRMKTFTRNGWTKTRCTGPPTRDVMGCRRSATQSGVSENVVVNAWRQLWTVPGHEYTYREKCKQ